MIKKTVPILVGGPSGVGKSSLIRYLISHYKIFQRPKSFTTRKKRPDENSDEYIFVTEDEFQVLRDKSELLNDDLVYGNHYGTNIKSIENILLDNKFPIKEIHPTNFDKFRLHYPDLISVLVLPKDFKMLAQIEKKRYLDDFDYFLTVDRLSYDIIIYNDFQDTIKDLSSFLYRSIIALMTHDDAFPRPPLIDTLNSLGYDRLANFFDDSKRHTTRNFHTASIDFFKYAFEKYLTPESTILEIGPGQNWLSKNFEITCKQYQAIDISSKMCEFGTNIITTSIRDTCFPSCFFDCIIASLADPYFYPAALCEIGRILKPNGYFIFSTPSSKWSELVREDHNKTKFIIDDGTIIEVYSFTFALEIAKSILTDCGFEVVFSEEKKADILLYNNDPISPILIDAGQGSEEQIRNLVILNNIVAKKKDE